MEDYANGFSTDKITVPIQAIDRVEVIRGPMAVIYGSNAFMGVINIITNEDEKNQISVTTGSLNTHEVFMKLSKKSDGFKYNFIGSVSKSDGLDIAYSDLQSDTTVLLGYGLSPDARTKGQYQSENLYLNFSCQFDKFSFGLDYSNRGEGIPGMVPSFDFEKGWYAKIKAMNLFGQYKTKLTQNIDILLKYTNSSYRYNAYDVNVIVPNTFQYLDLSTHAQEFELNAFIDLSKKSKLIVGLNNRLVDEATRFIDVLSFGPNNSLVEPTNINTLAGFSQLEYNPTSKIKLIIGGRIEQTSNYWITSRSTTTNNAWLTNRKDKAEMDDIYFIPRLAGIYTFNDNNVIKVMYSQSKKRPSLAEYDNHFSSKGEGLNFASMSTFEIDYNTSIENKLNINASVYYNHLSDLIIRTFVVDSGVASSSTNSGVANTIGGELLLKADLSRKIRTELNVSLQKTNDISKGNQGIEFAFSPIVLGYLRATYMLSRKISIGLKGRYVDEMYAQWNPDLGERYGKKVPKYFVFDINTRYEPTNKIHLSFYISNFLNQRIRYPSSQYSTWTDLGMIGYGRRLQFAFGYQF